MAAPDLHGYMAVMEEIKRRIALVSALVSNSITVMYKATQVELMVLQVRMVTELVALASLAANKEIFEANQKKFAKGWHPKDIFKDVEVLNPDFYPRPLVEVPSAVSGVKNDLVDLKDGFMTRDELVEVHGRCGNVLHARNPYGKQRDLDAYEQQVPVWIKRIMKLLNRHRIRLLDVDRFYLVHMETKGRQGVRIHTFERRDA